MKYLKSFRLYEDMNKPGSGTGIMREVGQFEAELIKKLNILGNGSQSYMNFREPDFSEDKIRKFKDVTNAFFSERPFSKVTASDIIEVSKKMVGLTNIETLLIYYSILLSEVDKVSEMYEKLKKEAEKTKNNERDFQLGPDEINKTTTAYMNWVKCLKLVKTAVESPDFLTKIIPDKKELEVSYKKKDGGEADGDITGFDFKDDGGIEFTIDNEKVGEIKKDLGELVMKKSDEKEDDENVDVEKDLIAKLSELKMKRPDDIRRVSNFTNFISNDNNKDKIDNIYKIIGI